jgi:hypothetical protein
MIWMLKAHPVVLVLAGAAGLRIDGVLDPYDLSAILVAANADLDDRVLILREPHHNRGRVSFKKASTGEENGAPT